MNQGFFQRFLRNLPVLRKLSELRIGQERLVRDLATVRQQLAWEIEDRRRERARAGDARSLRPSEQSVYSQNGEDGVLVEIFRRIGAPTRTFVELGVGDGWENNTLFLLTQGWSGAWIDGDPRFEATLAEWPPELAARLRRKVARVTRENVGALLTELGVPREPDLLSLDLDQNTYHVWSALRDWRPRVAVVEYNAILPPSVDWAVPYEPHQGWDESINYGASLKALERLGGELGYRLVHCESIGVNAFFVRADLAGDGFETPATAEHHFRPLRFHYLEHAPLRRRVLLGREPKPQP